jgi:glutamine amidotransferase
VLAALVAEIAAHGTINMMLSSGGELWAHCSTHLHYLVRQYPFETAMLSDEDMKVDFSEVTTPNDRVAVIVTQPLTTNERWTAFGQGELKLFIDGLPQA